MNNNFPLQYFNPLAGLDEYRLADYLSQGERGAYATLQWLYRFIEKRNATARAVKRRLLASIGRLEWKIKTTDCDGDAAKQAAADKQAATLRAAYDRVKNLQRALQHLASAELRGFAHVEKIFAAGDGRGGGDPTSITELRVVEQWFWVRDGVLGKWQYNREARQGVFTGEAVDLSRFIAREVDDPVNEIVAKMHVRMEASDSDWDGFLEGFGIPSTFVELPPNVPESKEAEYQRQAEKIAADSRGAIPNGAKVHMIAAAPGASVHKERLDYLASQIVIAATSGKLTILTESGSGTLAGGAQADAFDDIAEAIAADLSMTMQDQFDAPLLAAKHQGEPVLAYFDFGPVSEKDGSKALNDAKTAREAGYAMDAEQLSEESGYKLTAAPQPEATPPTPAPLPAPKSAAVPAGGEVAGGDAGAPAEAAPVTPANLANATAAQLGVTPEYLAPVEQTFAALIADAQDGAISNDEFIARAEELLKKLPQLAKMMDATGIAAKLADAMRDAAESAVGNTAADAVQPA
jgi:hypothetical protein